MTPPMAVESIAATEPFTSSQNAASSKKTTPAQFDPAKHLAYSPPSKILKMEDLGLSSTAISSLFTPEVLDNCLHHTRPGSVQLRGMAPRYAPFIHQFWHSPEVLRIISENAGVDLVPAMDYEICHTNVQLGPDGIAGVRATPVEPPAATEEAIAQFEKEKPKPQAVTDQTKPIIEWHKDSHPFVCVVMLSDARHMVGGETELLKADGTTVKVKSPQMGCAVILQGRHITHTAAPAANMPERITIVTSFRPRDPTLLDETTNANVRNKSHLTELYYQWTTYRLEVLAERARIAVEALRKKYEENVKKTDEEGKKGLCRVETVNVAEMEKWANEQINYIKQTLYKMRPLGQ
ncbi:hypothetical protein M432DRAFT_638677 [Thermoascus aurantiacus ATCC 26904]